MRPIAANRGGKLIADVQLNRRVVLKPARFEELDEIRRKDFFS